MLGIDQMLLPDLCFVLPIRHTSVFSKSLDEFFSLNDSTRRRFRCVVNLEKPETEIEEVKLMGQHRRYTVILSYTSIMNCFPIAVSLMGYLPYSRILTIDRDCLIFGGADGVEVPFLPSDSRRRMSYRTLALRHYKCHNSHDFTFSKDKLAVLQCRARNEPL